ncbi:hypothetical protein LSAT2_022912 [Lamellibrachia satsuma]|nr:hypothetical protein LSAT2_022912 [Lamellibrachia satsuma]
MDSKGTQEEIVYPNIFFTVDNFEEAFADIVVRDSEMVCVELVAQDRHAAFQGVIFLGSIRYEALKKIYDARASLTHRMAQRMSLSWFKGHKRVEFVRMRGPLGKGHAEMAVSRQKGSGPETPDQTPNTEKFFMEDFENQGAEEAFTHRRMSDPNVSWHNFGSRASFKRSSIRKTCSETENVNAIGTSNCEEVEADSIEDAFDENIENGFFGKSFGQAWHWFKEKRRSNSVALHAYLTYVTLPWHRIIADVLEMRQEPVLSF